MARDPGKLITISPLIDCHVLASSVAPSCRQSYTASSSRSANTAWVWDNWRGTIRGLDWPKSIDQRCSSEGGTRTHLAVVFPLNNNGCVFIFSLSNSWVIPQTKIHVIDLNIETWNPPAQNVVYVLRWGHDDYQHNQGNPAQADKCEYSMTAPSWDVVCMYVCMHTKKCWDIFFFLFHVFRIRERQVFKGSIMWPILSLKDLDWRQSSRSFIWFDLKCSMNFQLLVNTTS